ncbi:hypothetical protein ACFS3C_12360 [Azotobacter vinelandii]
MFYVESHEQACRLECSFQDHLVQKWRVSFDQASIINSDTILFIAGTKTAAQGSKKNDLFTSNKKNYWSLPSTDEWKEHYSGHQSMHPVRVVY